MLKPNISGNKKLISQISKTIYAICLIFIIYTFYENRYQISILSEKLNIKIILIIILIGILRSYLESLVLFSLSTKFCKNINFFDFSVIYFKTALSNHGIPHYGTIYRSFLLKQKGLNYIDYAFSLSIFKLLKIFCSVIFIIILFFIFLREYLSINSNFFLFIVIFFVGLFLILITFFILIQLFKKNETIIKLHTYFKKAFKNLINFKIILFISLIILIEFSIFNFVFSSISNKTLQLLIVIYIFRIITGYIPLIQINTAHVAISTLFSSFVGLKFVDSFLINLSSILVGIISLTLSILIQKFLISTYLNLKKNHG